jgi:hypothetical protein
MLELTVGDRVRSREADVTGTVMRREHDFEHPRYVIEWDDGKQSEIWPGEDPDLEERLEPAADMRRATTMTEEERQPLHRTDAAAPDESKR